jgi:hypothetical protein
MESSVIGMGLLRGRKKGEPSGPQGEPPNLCIGLGVWTRQPSNKQNACRLPRTLEPTHLDQAELEKPTHPSLNGPDVGAWKEEYPRSILVRSLP